MTTGFKLTTGWPEMTLLLSSRLFSKRLQRELLKAAALAGMAGAKAGRKAIQSGKFAKNAALTVALKGSDAPLKGTAAGGLFQAITYKVVRWDQVFVGVLRTDGKYNIAETVHNGKAIKVTAKMRDLFRVLWLASAGKLDASKLDGRAAELFDKFKDWRPLRAGTNVINIPARPFMQVAFSDPSFQAAVRRVWTAAIAKAMTRAA